ncbi:hypothetical protein PENSPDRAFT_251954 [Peniophora sp. CONT]|nr:hypothetical protein PENSPDRAFT_251954 [Peniophora sp. CONT]
MNHQTEQQQPLAIYRSCSYTRPSQCTVLTDGVYEIDADLPELRLPMGKAGATPRAYAVANAILRDMPERVLPAIPRHMLPHLPRTLRERLDHKMGLSSKSKRGTRPRTEAFQHRGSGSSPLALSEEDFEARRQRRQQRTSAFQRLARWKRIIDFKSCRVEHDLQGLHAASTRGEQPSPARNGKCIEGVVQDLQDVISSMRALLWAFFDYLDSQHPNCASDDTLELLQSIAEVIMEADFDEQLDLVDGGMSVAENTCAVLELAEDMNLTRAQINQIWEELELQSSGMAS